MTNDFPVSVRTECVCLNLLFAASKRECLQHKASDSESRELEPGFLTAHPARCSHVGMEEQTPCCRSHKASTVGTGTLYNVFIISLKFMAQMSFTEVAAQIIYLEVFLTKHC